MRIRGMFVLALAGGVAVSAHAKNKKDAPQQFCQAHSVYVQTVNGDPLGPNVAPDDRSAANALIGELGDWKRYEVVKDPSQADLIFVVKAGRSSAANNTPGGNPGGGGRQNPNAGANQDSSGMSPTPGGAGGQGRGGISSSMGGVPDEMSAAANNSHGATPGSQDDILAIYQKPNGGPLTSPLWQRTQKGGLQAPKGTLFEQVKTAVDASCVNQPAAAPAQ
jgi:hypothetical protein